VGGEGREGFVTRVAGEGGERGTGLQDSGVGDGREGSGAEEGLDEGGEGGKGVGVGLALVAWIPQGLAAVLNKVKFSFGVVASRLGLGFRPLGHALLLSSTSLGLVLGFRLSGLEFRLSVKASTQIRIHAIHMSTGLMCDFNH
jgi:hypothetical protein